MSFICDSVGLTFLQAPSLVSKSLAESDSSSVVVAYSEGEEPSKWSQFLVLPEAILS